ncbi:MAG: hypothetical protein MJ107_02975 [Lachnospiraceae bacterium]|nr:hypothetical protein [Lachnospiraceae bacterium]
MGNRKKEVNYMVYFWAAVLSVLTYYFVINEFSDPRGDYTGHVYSFIAMYTREHVVEGFMAAPYVLWHIVTLFFNRIIRVPIESAAAYSSCVYTALSFFITEWMINKTVIYETGETDRKMSAFLAFVFNIVQPIFFYWYDAMSQYYGQFSINPLHNPTHMCVKPFSLLALCLTYEILMRHNDENWQGIFFYESISLKRLHVYLGLVLAVSTVAKPTFAEMFIPAVGIYMLIEWIVRLAKKNKTAGEYFKKCLLMLATAAPALMIILFQVLLYFIFGGSYGGASGGLIITKWLEVWNMFTENVPVSIMLGMAFPIYVVFINGGYFVKNVLGRLSLISYGVGFLEAAILGEETKLEHGNFLWPMMSGMTILWISALLRFVALACKTDSEEEPTAAKRILLGVGWILLFAHMIAGFIYYYNHVLK